MKKIMALLAAMIVVVGLNAQEVGSGKFGIKAGVGIANIAVQDQDNVGARLGFYAGLTYEYRVSNVFAFAPEVVYSLQGAGASESSYIGDYSSSSLEVDYMTNLSYINIPLMAKFYVGDKFSFDLGPQIGLLVGAQYKLTYEGETEKASIKDGCNTLDFAIAAGATYNITDNLYINARYNLGLTKVVNSDDGLYNRVFHLGLGYKF